MWTLFWDMHSGGGTKEEPYEKIYIEAPSEEAVTIFYNKFGHNPHRVTCTCCGPDYSIEESETLGQASAYHRNCEWDDENEEYIEEERSEWGSYKTVEEYEEQDDVLVIRDDDIRDEERTGHVPVEGYVWK